MAEFPILHRLRWRSGLGRTTVYVVARGDRVTSTPKAYTRWVGGTVTGVLTELQTLDPAAAAVPVRRVPGAERWL